MMKNAREGERGQGEETSSVKTTAASLSEPEAPGPPPLQENRLLRECGCWSLNALSGRVANTENSPGFEKLPSPHTPNALYPPELRS